MKSARAIAITAIMLLILCFSSIFVDVHADDSIPVAVFSGFEKPHLKVILRDLVTSIQSGVEVSAYINGGIPSGFVLKSSKDFIILNMSILLNKRSLESINPRYFEIEVGGFYTKTFFNFNNFSITLYSVPLYSTKSFYVSICLKATTSINVTIAVNLGKKYSTETLLGSGAILDVNGTSFAVYTPLEKAITKFNESTMLLQITLHPDYCTNVLLGFNKSIVDIAKNIAEQIDYTKNVFKDFIHRFPMIQTVNTQINNLYILSLYNTLNMVSKYGLEDNVIGLYPEELSSYIYLTRLSNITLSLKNETKVFEAGKGFSMELANYIYYYIDKYPHIISLANNLLNSLKTLVKTCNRSSELAKIYSAVNAIYVAALYIGNSDIVFKAKNTESYVLSKLNSLYQGNFYALSMEEKILNSNNILEAISIALYSVPNSENHINYAASFLRYIDVNSISITRRFISDALEALIRHGFSDLALKILLKYYNAVVYAGVPCIDFYRVVLRGFLGIQPIFNSIVISPNVPAIIANTSLKTFLCEANINVRYLNWGSKVMAIYIDTLYHMETAIPCSILQEHRLLTILLSKSIFIPIYVEFYLGGVPVKNTYIELYTSSGLTQIGYTNDSGVAIFTVPCNEKWISIKTNNITTNIDLSGWSCKTFKITINAPPQKDNEIAKTVNSLVKNVNELNDKVNKIGTNLTMLINNVVQRLNNVVENNNQVMDKINMLKQRQDTFNILLYTSILLAAFSLGSTLLLVSMAKRK